MSELLGALGDTLDRDFQIKVGIGGNSENAKESGGAKETVKRYILVGASNLNRVVAHLEREGAEVINLCIPGWMATPPNVTTMIERLALTKPDESTMIVLDVFGNTTFRYENWDGSVFMPVKSGGGVPPSRYGDSMYRWHLLEAGRECATAAGQLPGGAAHHHPTPTKVPIFGLLQRRGTLH